MSRETFIPEKVWNVALEMYDQAGLPRIAKVEETKEDSLPVDTDRVTNSELGQLLFKYGRLRGYCARMTVQWDITHGALKKARDIRLYMIVDGLEKSAEKKRLKDSMESEAISSDPVLNQLVKKCEQAEANYKMFSAHYDIFKNNWETISREITRRSDEMKEAAREGMLR